MQQFLLCAVLEWETYARSVSPSPVDTKDSFGWLKTSNISGATKETGCSRPKALRTRHYEHHILHGNVSPTCRVSSAGLETVDHVVAGCSAIAPTDNTDRHNLAASSIHWNIFRHFQVPVESMWYRYQPDRLVRTSW